MLNELKNKMNGFSHSWWVAGGWAIDLHIGSQQRQHKDVDLAVLRKDQKALRDCFSHWSFKKIINSEFYNWESNEYIESPVHEVHATNNGEHIEFLLNESDEDSWLFRRNPTVTMPLDKVTRMSLDGIPYLCAEIVLLYKAKTLRSYDEEDFERVIQMLDSGAKEWLANSLEICHPKHQWIRRL